MVDYRRQQSRIAGIFEKQIAFIVGASRWGTTWLQHALDAHPEICAGGEGHFSDNLFPMLLKVLDKYNRDAETTDQRLRAGGYPGNDVGYSFDDVDFLMATAAGLAFSHWVDEEPEGIKCIVEKTPEHVLHLELLTRAFDGCKVIHVFRDGRDEACETWSFNMRVGAEDFGQRFPKFADFTEYFARNWVRSVGAARRYGRTHRKQYFQTRSEYLMDDPVPIVRRLCRFVGVADDTPLVQDCVTAADDVVERSTAAVGVWRDQFDDEALSVFNRQAGELIKLLNYEDEADRERAQA